MQWSICGKIMKGLNMDHIKGWHTSYCMHHIYMLPQNISLCLKFLLRYDWSLYSELGHGTKGRCTHWKPNLPQRKNCFDHKSIFSEVRGWGPIGRMKLAACKKLKLIWKSFCSNILGNWIIPLGILKPVTMPTTFQV